MTNKPTHKDLSDEARESVGIMAVTIAGFLREFDQSLAIGREAMINAFDKAAEGLDNG